MKIFLFSAIAVLAVSCATTTITTTANFSDVPDKEWKLIEVYINGRNTGFNRNSLARGVYPEMYTLSFNAELISGTGAPNRYTAPYTTGENRTIKIALVRATLMAAISENSSLREYDYFSYVQNVYEWNIVNDNLELHSKLENNSEVRLVFSL